MALSSASAKRGSGPQTYQAANATIATTTTAGTNHADTASASRWIGARVRCASPTIRTICASTVSLPTRSARMTKLPVPLMVAPVTRCPGFLDDGHRLSREHRFVDDAAALDDEPVGRDLLARPDAQAIAQADVRDRLVELLAVADDARRARRKVEQLPDRGARAAARPQLENLAEEHEHGDHDRGIEVGLDGAVHAEAGRERAAAPASRRR